MVAQVGVGSHTWQVQVKDAAGNTVGLQGMFWDVTARKEAERSTRHGEVFEDSPHDTRILFQVNWAAGPHKHEKY